MTTKRTKARRDVSVLSCHVLVRHEGRPILASPSTTSTFCASSYCTVSPANSTLSQAFAGLGIDNPHAYHISTLHSGPTMFLCHVGGADPFPMIVGIYEVERNSAKYEWEVQYTQPGGWADEQQTTLPESGYLFFLLSSFCACLRMSRRRRSAEDIPPMLAGETERQSKSKREHRYVRSSSGVLGWPQLISAWPCFFLYLPPQFPQFRCRGRTPLHHSAGGSVYFGRCWWKPPLLFLMYIFILLYIALTRTYRQTRNLKYQARTFSLEACSTLASMLHSARFVYLH